MCFYCPSHLTIERGGCAIHVVRIADTKVAPADLAHSRVALDQFRAGQRFIVALQATVYVDNRPVFTESLHGITESDLEGELACAFEHRAAMESLLGSVQETAYAIGYLRQVDRVLY